MPSTIQCFATKIFNKSRLLKSVLESLMDDDKFSDASLKSVSDKSECILIQDYLRESTLNVVFHFSSIVTQFKI